MARTYRQSTPKERQRLEKSREMTERGIQGEKDFLSKISTTMAKAARDDIKMGKKMYESVPEEAREYEAYNAAGYKSGGLVTSRGQGQVMRKKKTRMCC